MTPDKRSSETRDRRNKKRESFLAANTYSNMGLVHTGIKKYPMCKMKYSDVSLMLWA